MFRLTVFYWPIQSRLPQASCRTGGEPRRGLFYLAIRRDHSDLRFSSWTVDESELEAVLGLWAWTLSKQCYSKTYKTIRILSSNQSSDAYDLNLWRELGGTPITQGTLSEVSSVPSLLCGLQNLSGEPSDDSVQALKVEGTIPQICAQEVYSLFFKAIIVALVENIGGETDTSNRSRTFMLKNTTISSVQKAFTKHGLGSADDAFACTIPALISSAKLPSLLGTLSNARKAAEQYIKTNKWDEAEKLLQWALKQCSESKKPKVSDSDSVFDFENHQRLLILDLCECYRKSVLNQESSDLGIEGISSLNDKLMQSQKEIKLSARDATSETIDPTTLAITVECFRTATLRLKKEMSEHLEGVSQLGSTLQTKDTDIAISCTVFPTNDEEIAEVLNDAIEKKDLVETLYLISRIEILKRKVKLNQSLSKASEQGWYIVVQALMDLVASPHSRDHQSRTAITYAALGGDFNTFRYLFKEGLYPNFMDKHSSRSSISYASEKGFLRIVQKLLTDGRVDVDSKDKDHRTPLSYAAGNGHEEVVKLLMERNDVDADSKDRWNTTPLSYATKNGHEAVVELLMKRNDVDADSKNDSEKTPLSEAATNGHETVVKLLTERDDVDADSKDRSKTTPLSYAAKNGHEAVVKLLMKRNDVDADSKDTWNTTPLSYAARNGHEAVVKLLMKRNDVDVDAKDSRKMTPLSHAAGRGHKTIIKLLMERNDVDVNSKDQNGKTPLSHAAINGHETIIKLLMERNDVDVNSKDQNGETPLSHAAINGHETIIKLLMERNDVDVNSKGQNEKTPLLHAAENGHETIIKLLAERDVDIDIDSKTYAGQTPLALAAKNGHEAVVKLLMKRNDVDLNSKDWYGNTPLSWAEKMGQEKVVKLLKSYLSSSPQPSL